MEDSSPSHDGRSLSWTGSAIVRSKSNTPTCATFGLAAANGSPSTPSDSQPPMRMGLRRFSITCASPAWQQRPATPEPCFARTQLVHSSSGRQQRPATPEPCFARTQLVHSSSGRLPSIDLPPRPGTGSSQVGGTGSQRPPPSRPRNRSNPALRSASKTSSGVGSGVSTRCPSVSSQRSQHASSSRHPSAGPSEQSFDSSRRSRNPPLDKVALVAPMQNGGSDSMERYVELQTEALEVLIEYLGPSQPIDKLANTLLENVFLRDGSAVSRAVFAQIIQAQTPGTATPDESAAGATEPEPADPADTAAEAAEAIETIMLDDPPSTQRNEVCGASTPERLVLAFHALAECSKMTFSGIVGQILWRHRTAPPLQQLKYRRIIEDLIWVDDRCGSQELEEVFRACSRGNGGKMNWRSWQKLVNLIRRNPILQLRVTHCDADRLFYSETHRGEARANRCITVRQLPRLLLNLAEAAKVYPGMIFMAISCHAASQSAERL